MMRTYGLSKILKSAESGSESRLLREPSKIVSPFSSNRLPDPPVDTEKKPLRGFYRKLTIHSYPVLYLLISHVLDAQSHVVLR